MKVNADTWWSAEYNRTLETFYTHAQVHVHTHTHKQLNCTSGIVAQRESNNLPFLKTKYLLRNRFVLLNSSPQQIRLFPLNQFTVEY